MSILPNILSDDDLQAGNSLNFSSMYGANLIGSALAGVVVTAFSAGAGLVIDAATFVVSALSLALMRPTSIARSSKSQEAASAAYPEDDAKEQEEKTTLWSFLRTSRLIQVILLVAIMAGLCWGGLLEVALPALVHGPMRRALEPVRPGDPVSVRRTPAGCGDTARDDPTSAERD